MRVYQCSGHIFTVTQRKVSVIKHRCLFSLSYSAHFTGVRAQESREPGGGGLLRGKKDRDDRPKS